jgi:nicotinamidase-related amidase
MYDPADVQVLFTDIQVDHLDRTTTNPPATIIKAASVLSGVARLLDIPAAASVLGPPGTRSVPEIADQFPDTEFPRLSPCALLDEATAAHLRSNGRKTVILGGIATEIVVLHTALEAVAAGFDVHVAIDLCGGISARTEDATLRRLESSGVRLTTVLGVCTGLTRDFTRPPDDAVLQAAFDLL